MLLKFLRLIVQTFFREIIIKGQENLPPSGSVIFTPNHPNALIDPLLLLYLPPQFRIRFVAKAPLFKIPLLGWIIRQIGAIPVVRRLDVKGKVDYEAFFSSCVETLAAGESIVIFPEGRSLPQPFMTSLRTGAARLFFLAREKGIDVSIVPVGLNYERGSVFRTPVVVSVAPPLDTSVYIDKHKKDPNLAVRELTDEVARTLDEHVFQANDFRDRHLIMLLDRIYNQGPTDVSWPERLRRLKKFEEGLNTLRHCCSREIDQLRRMLSQYEIQSLIVKKTVPHSPPDTPSSMRRFFKAIIGFPLAALGVLLNLVPYKICGFLVNALRKHNEAEAATYKVIYSIFLYPLAFLGECLLLHWWIGWPASIPFAIGIIPLSYFTLFYFEWLNDGGWGMSLSLKRFEKINSSPMTRRLQDDRLRIQDQVDLLAERLDALNEE